MLCEILGYCNEGKNKESCLINIFRVRTPLSLSFHIKYQYFTIKKYFKQAEANSLIRSSLRRYVDIKAWANVWWRKNYSSVGRAKARLAKDPGFESQFMPNFFVKKHWPELHHDPHTYSRATDLTELLLSVTKILPILLVWIQWGGKHSPL